MDAEAVGAALTPAALAPPIAESLGLPGAAVTAALSLLAEGAQPAFVARYRPERTRGLSIRDLERIQAQAARAVGFEFKRQELAAELQRKHVHVAHLVEHLRAARSMVDLEDLRVLLKRRKRGPAAKARAAGLGPAALALWSHACPESVVELMRATEALFESRRARGGGPTNEAESTHEDHDDAAHDESASADPDPSTTHPDGEDASAEGEDAFAAGETAPAGEDASVEGEDASAAGEDATAEADPAGTDAAQGGVHDEVSEPGFGAVDPTLLVESIAAGSLGTYPQAIAGARAICADHIGESVALRARLRALLLENAKVSCQLAPGKNDKGGRYGKFAQLNEPAIRLPASAVLALHRGEREGVLLVDLEIDRERVMEAIVTELSIDTDTPAGEELLKAAEDAWEHGLGKAVRAGVRKLLKRRADIDAISEFSAALRPLLLAPALGPKPLLSIDAGHQNGCRLVALDGQGKFLAQDTVFPLQPKLQVPQAKARIIEMCAEHGLAAIVVMSGAAGREVERMCRDLVRETEALQGVVVTSVDPDAAALHASSRGSKEEFRDADAALRRAMAAGRRVQDPLLELIKIDPRKLGLGQHQHEVDQEELRTALEQVTVSCVSEVCVDVNAASAELLPWVAGMSHALAKATVGHRDARGGLRSRSELLEVPGFAGKAFEQAAGFLRIRGGEQKLDETMIHPERYPQVTEMARDLGVTVADLVGNDELIDQIAPEKYLDKPGISGEPLGRETFEFILRELRQPGRDPRPEFTTVEYHPDLKQFEDLQVGMELEGIVTHLAAFGAFVDVGIAQEGLVHVSELSHGFISSPLDAVHVGQKVRGRVIELSSERKRFSLSLKALMPRPERGPGRKPDAQGGKGRNRAEGPGNGPGKGKPKGKGKGPGGPGGPGRDNRDNRDNRGKRPEKERTLGFRLDLSELASRLDPKR